jgi:hypothetical protein
VRNTSLCGVFHVFTKLVICNATVQSVECSEGLLSAGGRDEFKPDCSDVVESVDGAVDEAGVGPALKVYFALHALEISLE